MKYERMQLQKLIHTVTYLLKENNGSLNYTKLIKLLYIIDKKALERWDDTVTGDRYVSMNNGPVLSKVYDLIKDNGSDFDQCEWDIHFLKKNYDLKLKNENISWDELSDAEIELIEEIDREFKNKTYIELIDYVHNNELFPEWKDPVGSSKPIEMEDILKSLGRSEKEIPEIIETIRKNRLEQKFFIDNLS